MTDQDYIDDLLLRWEDNTAITPEELCRDCPELLPRVCQGIRDLQAISPLLESLTLDASLGTRNQEAPDLPTVPGYDILGLLGRGGMGVVYQARHIKLNRTVALKMIRAGEHARSDELRRFLSEAETVAQLRHPHIVQIYEVGQHGSLPYLALEFLDGGSLADRLRGTPLPARQAAQLTETLARAIHAAHQCGIIHRDLKPANILLQTNASTDQVAATNETAARNSLSGTPVVDFIPKIADFGLAKRLQDGAELTQTGAVVGTASYMAPEQAQGRSRLVGPAADVYALGCILYECLTGRPPFRAATPLETLQQVVSRDPISVRALQPGISRDLETVCLKCLRKEPEKRYVSAGALAADLRCILQGEPIQARPIGRGERLARWARRRPGVAALLTALILVTVAGFASVIWLYRDAARERDGARAADRARVRVLIDQLGTATPDSLTAILATLQEDQEAILPRLRELWANGGAERQRRMRAGMALLPTDPQLDKGPLCEWMLDADNPGELLLTRNILMPFKDDLKANLWRRVEEPTTPGNARFRALVALAAFDPDPIRWTPFAPLAAKHLLRADARSLSPWTEALTPVRRFLLKPLAEAFRGPPSQGLRQVAANVLSVHFKDDPELLANLSTDADAEQFNLLRPFLLKRPEQASQALRRELDQIRGPDNSESGRDQLAQRQANAALGLLNLNKSAEISWLFKHRPDPLVRSYLIHRLGPWGTDARTVASRFDQETDLEIRRALLLSLGEFGEEHSSEVRRQLLPLLQELYRTVEDPGFHAAAEWLLREWHQEAWLDQVNSAWAKDVEQRRKRLEKIRQLIQNPKDKPQPQWYVNGERQTMVVIPGPVQFTMGSPPDETDRRDNELQHHRSIGRSFVMAAKPVTKGQFLEFLPGFSSEAMSFYPDPTCPIGGIKWYEAAAYCNWLSKREGISEGQWCYEMNSDGQVVKLKENYLSLTGYRLPTEAEWEYACRAGAITSRYYGSSEEPLLPRYGWYMKNSGRRTHPVGTRKPNDLGMFDMHGNLACWCQESYKPYPHLTDDSTVPDVEDSLVLQREAPRVLRGGSFVSLASDMRCASRFRLIPTYGDLHVGVRPARTFR